MLGAHAIEFIQFHLVADAVSERNFRKLTSLHNENIINVRAQGWVAVDERHER